MTTYEDIKKANESIITTGIERKDKNGNITIKEYAEVNQRIKAFRIVYPTGTIKTELISNENGVCIFKAEVGATFGLLDTKQDKIEEFYRVLGTGTAYEKENSTFINKTSYIENCETSAVGRALGMAGFGIDTSVASFEEVANAIEQQNTDVTINKNMEIVLRNLIEEHKIENEKVLEILGSFGYKKLVDIKVTDFKTIVEKLSE